ncbi:hypothetical protein [Infirmifilum uzonense]|nr:hypothetical protein [Infirmifilum uzonense]
MDKVLYASILILAILLLFSAIILLEVSPFIGTITITEDGSLLVPRV